MTRVLSKKYVDKNKDKFIKRLEYEKNNEYQLIGEYKTMRTPTTFRHKCGYEWTTQPKTLIDAEGLLGCPHCQYRMKSKTTEQFKKDIRIKTNGEYILVEGQKYKTNREKLKFKHIKCGTEFYMIAGSILREQESCPYCRSLKPSPSKRSTESFKKDLLREKDKDYTLVSEYTHALEKVKIKHTCGNTWWVRPYHILYDNSCPYCYGSTGELLIADLLANKGIDYKREYIFKDCKYIGYLRFDFMFTINNNIILIEYDGEQHFKPVEYFGGQETFEKTKERDKIKDKYCDDKGYMLLRIPYYYSNEEVKIKINNFIETVKQRTLNQK